MESFPKERTANNNLSPLKLSERRLISSVPFEKMCLDRAADLGGAAACSELTLGALIQILRMKKRRNSQERAREEDMGFLPSCSEQQNVRR